LAGIISASRDDFSKEPQSDETHEEGIARQFSELAASHSLVVGGSHYAHEKKLHPKLTPYQQQTFRHVSDRWHRIFNPSVLPVGTVQQQRSPFLRDTLCEMVGRVMTNIPEALKKLFGYDSFVSQTLKLVMLEVIGRQRNTLIVTPTGSGKSMLFWLPAAIDKDRTTVAFAPLKALKHQIAHSPPEAITPVVWNKNNEFPTHLPALLLCQPEDADDPRLESYLDGLARQDLLARIVYDEAPPEWAREPIWHEGVKVTPRAIPPSRIAM
jgi:hypothetical protein